MKKVLGKNFLEKFFMILVLEMGLGGGAEAGNLYVPGSYATIQAAVNAASPGDTITVSAGTYIEVVYVNKGIKNLAQNSGKV